MLVELSVVEQRYHAVLEVLAGARVTEVAARYGVSRKQVHVWLRRYADDGLGGLVDRSHRPRSHPHQVDAAVEALVVQLRTVHPRWGPMRLVHEVGRRGLTPPSKSTVYRVLVRHGLVAARPRKRRREDYMRWERDAAMQLWQLDVMGSVRLVDGSEAKLISGVDDHSRYCVIANVVPRATGVAVCRAFSAALVEFGLPEQVLTDNGKQFTGKYGRPRPAEVLFDRICRKNGVEHLLTKIRSPTTTGKVERWHQTIQRELLDELPPFDSVAHAQVVVDGWRVEYNSDRPHQSLDMAVPADRFALAAPRREPLWLPLGLGGTVRAGEARPVLTVLDGDPPLDVEVEDASTGSNEVREADVVVAWSASSAVEVERPVPPSGNLQIGPQQFWFGPHRAGQVITCWVDSTTVHLSSGGRHLKTLPSRLSDRDVDRLRRAGARLAGPPPAARLPGRLLEGQPVEVDRVVNAHGVVSLAHRQLCVGSPLAGQRVTIRLDTALAHVVLPDGTLWRTMPFTLPARQRGRLQGARPAGHKPTPPVGPTRVQRLVSSRGGIQVAGQRVQVGYRHRRKTVTVELDDTVLRILDERETILTVIPRASTTEVTRHKAYGHRTVNQA